MKKIVENIQTTFESFQTEATAQLEDGNKSAGTRARKSSLELEKLLKEFRKVSIAESKK
ncbi:histone H1 [Antarcticibacterium sp. 1MA-6-2]|uniref:histone H1 n=1 Tax=Antarcticibacterium sp. 1MA-6-2 TaxID=2908210 RepID=UPI001F19640B|nr:histone H1 [Antarcticibacterium sp. 1MA-6-2]UJH90663.1 histone H1 [Antarcticibacterium sp. 1MA-6-2]